MKYYIIYLIISVICPNIIFGQTTRQDTLQVLSKAIDIPVLINHLVKNDSVLNKNFVGIKQNNILSDQTLMIYVDNSIHKSKQLPIWGREGCFNHGYTHEFVYLSVGENTSRVIYNFLPSFKKYNTMPSFEGSTVYLPPHFNIFVELQKEEEIWQIKHYEIRDLLITSAKEKYPEYYYLLKEYYVPMTTEEGKK